MRQYLPEGYRDEYLTDIVFESICDFVPQAVADLNVKAINSGTGDNLNYDDKTPQKVIAIGGNRLSRGFTLEGLTVNYFVRTTNLQTHSFRWGAGLVIALAISIAVFCSYSGRIGQIQ